MKNKVMLFTMILFLFNIGAQAQVKKAQISFTEKNHRLQAVKEEDPDITIDFDFSNTGNIPLVISDVKAESGLNVIDWPTEEIAPGAKGNIKVVFHPKGNANRVYKKITVYSNSKRNVETLSITGNVAPTPGSIADKYRKYFGETGLRLKSTYITLGNVSNKQKKDESIQIINDSDSDMKISFRNEADYMTVTSSADLLKPQQEAVITVIYDASQVKDTDGKQKWGAQRDRFYVVINDNTKESGRNSISVRGSIVEDFDNLSAEELAKAPKIEFNELVFDFGTIKQGATVTHDFVYKNIGENDLEIRHVKAT